MSLVPFPVPVVGLSWHARATCRQLVDAGEAHPATWDSHIAGERPVDRLVRLLGAQAACDTCPVAQRCLDEHLEGAAGGVRAGYVFDDDSDYRTQAGHAPRRDPLPREPAACGTARGARAHKYRGEDVCEPCDVAVKAEHAAQARKYRQQARERRERRQEGATA